MAEPGAGRERARRAAHDRSRGIAARPRAESRPAAVDLALAAGAVAAGVALAASTFATIVYLTVASASCDELAHTACRQTGGDRHGPAFFLLGALAVAIAAAWAARGSLVAALGLACIGAVTLAIALLDDVPQTHRTGAVGAQFVAARAHAGAGLTLEVVGGALALTVGAAALLRARSRVSDSR